jgi:hypothetical protein
VDGLVRALWGLRHTLVVEAVLANGYARVIYRVGTYEGWNIRQPHFWRAPRLAAICLGGGESWSSE